MNVSDTPVTCNTHAPGMRLGPALRRATLGLLAVASLGLAAPAGAHGGWERGHGWHGRPVRVQPWAYAVPVRPAPVIVAPAAYPYTYAAPVMLPPRPVIVHPVAEPVAPGVILGGVLGAYLGYQLSR